MDVTASTSVPTQTTASPSSTSAETATIDYKGFMQLLLAQLQNQDPTNPADPTEFTAQLATLSGVEQSIETNRKLGSLLSSMAISQSDGLIGRNITSSDGKVSGEVKSVTIASDGTSVATLTDGKSVKVEPGITLA